MFDGFNHTLFNDPNFKEDAVREEIVIPIIKRLGYSASGPNKIIRSKNLIHPFVMIGSKKHPVYIVPDYLLYSDGRPGLVIDAKRPGEPLVKSHHAEQAYSYAIHPEVRVRFYALCSGSQLVAYDIYATSPILICEFSEIEREWDLINSVLSPKNVSFASTSHLQPDFGMAVVQMGSCIGMSWIFSCVKLRNFMCVHENLFTMAATLPIADVDHLVTFDADRETFNRILLLTDAKNARAILGSLNPGKFIFSPSPIYASLHTLIGLPTRGQHDEFIPFIVQSAFALSEVAYEAAVLAGTT